MAKIQGVVRYDPAKPNDYGFYNVMIGKVRYSTGKTAPEGIAAGDSVEFEAEQNEKGYWNVKGPVTKVAAGAAGPSRKGGAQSVRTFPVPTRDPERIFVRQNALTNAVAAFGALAPAKQPEGSVGANILALAKHFEQYVCGDDERRIDEAKAAQRVAEQLAAKQKEVTPAVDGEFDDAIPF